MSVNTACKCYTCVVRCKNESDGRVYLLCVASDFLLNLPGLKDTLSFLKDINRGQHVNMQFFYYTEYDREKQSGW